MEITLALAALKLVGYGLSTIGPGLGIGIACYGCCVATARQPELQGSVADLSVSVASRLIGEDLNDAEHRKIIERYVNEAGSFNAN